MQYDVLDHVKMLKNMSLPFKNDNETFRVAHAWVM